MKWYYVQQGQQIGPVSDEQLAELSRNGTINPDTLIWREGMSEWQPYAQAAASASAIPPLSPAGAVCAECGKTFPVEEMIRHGAVYICANCKPVFMQKLAEGAQINTGTLNYAGFGVRFAAKFLDGLIIGLPTAILAFLVGLSATRSPNGAAEGFQVIFQVVMIFSNLAYQIFFLGKYGATLGKMACKIKVVTSDGGKIGYGRAAGRYFAELLSGMICYIGYLMVLFDKTEKRALHDHICNTRVVYK